MIECITFRKINEIERRMIDKSLSVISPNIMTFLTQSKRELFISFDEKIFNNLYPSIYLVPKEFDEIIRKILKASNLLWSGLYFGMLRKGKFNLSLEGADFLLKSNCFTENNKLQVNDDGEKSILYGNHVLHRNVSKVPPDLSKNQFLLVVNRSNELIAIARSRGNYLETMNLKPDDIFAYYLIDKGYYLRVKQ